VKIIEQVLLIQIASFIFMVATAQNRY